VHLPAARGCAGDFQRPVQASAATVPGLRATGGLYLVRTWVSGLRRPRDACCELVLGHQMRPKKQNCLGCPEQVSHLVKRGWLPGEHLIG
jgi:hypothetical protein